MDKARDILRFWFGEISATSAAPPAENGADTITRQNRLWFEKSDKTDQMIRERYARDLEEAATGAYDSWATTPHGRLALIILLDQFSRNIHRGTPRAFTQDARALELAKAAVDTGLDRELQPLERVFVYLPFEHAEDLAMQETSVVCFTRLHSESAPDLRSAMSSFLDYAIRHRDVIARFGRFPHRNAILGRDSTPEEVEFLKQPGSSF